MADDDDDVQEAAGVIRSPRYPALSLKDAVAKVKAIYTKDKTAGTPLTAAYPLMGYKSKSGPAMTALAALKRFGLAEVRNGRIYPTKRGVAVSALPEQDDRHKAALKEAVLSPGLYKSWLEQYSETGLPSPESLKHELLLDDRFNHNAVPGLVDDFFESLNFAGLTDANGVLLAVVDGGGDDDEDEDDDNANDLSKRKKVKKRVLEPGTKEDVFALDDGALVVQWPERIRGASADDIDIWLKLVSSKLKRAVSDGKNDEAE